MQCYCETNMKKRSLPVILLLALVTLHIYVFFWLYATRKDLVRQAGNPKAIPRLIWLFLPAIVFIVVLLAGALTSLSGAPGNSIVKASAFLVGPLGIIGLFVIPLWWFYHYFTVLHKVTQGSEPVLLYVIWIICLFVGFLPVWMLLAQNDINKAADRLTQASSPPQPPTAPAAIN